MEAPGAYFLFMGIDAPNLQGANLRQVLVQADHAAQILNQSRRDGGEFQQRLGAAIVEKALRVRDQTESAEMVVRRQEDNAQFSAGDSLLGGGGGGGDDSEHNPSSKTDEYDHHDSDSAPGLHLMEDPFLHCDRLCQTLAQTSRAQLESQFQGIDRRLLAGLLDPT
ncbi:MAG: hypothetical protein IPN71_21125 [Fibrobacteres bacterium]|nr:hypothetical protein [Fibrobacterota bacterium]